MERVHTDAIWSLFDPDDVPLLQATYGQAFTYAYEQYERNVEPTSTIKATDLWDTVCLAQKAHTHPFCLFSCTINRESAHHREPINPNDLPTLQARASRRTSDCFAQPPQQLRSRKYQRPLPHPAHHMHTYLSTASSPKTESTISTRCTKLPDSPRSTLTASSTCSHIQQKL